MKYTNTREVSMKEDARVRPRNVNWEKRLLMLPHRNHTVLVFSLISSNILQHQGFTSVCGCFSAMKCIHSG